MKISFEHDFLILVALKGMISSGKLTQNFITKSAMGPVVADAYDILKNAAKIVLLNHLRIV